MDIGRRKPRVRSQDQTDALTAMAATLESYWDSKAVGQGARNHRVDAGEPDGRLAAAYTGLQARRRDGPATPHQLQPHRLSGPVVSAGVDDHQWPPDKSRSWRGLGGRDGLGRALVGTASPSATRASWRGRRHGRWRPCWPPARSASALRPCEAAWEPGNSRPHAARICMVSALAVAKVRSGGAAALDAEANDGTVASAPASGALAAVAGSVRDRFSVGA